MKVISVDEVQNYIREVYLLQQNNSSLYYQFQYISIDVKESDITMIKSLKRKQINTDKHEITKRKRKDSYAAITGIPRHKKRKEAIKIFSQAQHTNITGTSEHEKPKEAMRNRKQDIYVLRELLLLV